VFKDKSYVKFRSGDQADVQTLVQSLGISKTIARILVNRGISTPDQANKFIHTDVKALHNPFLLKDMGVAVERILRALEEDDKICIYGDYDVDGAVATSLLILFFEQLGIKIDYYIPNRISEGYSINKKSLDVLKGQDTDLIITVDNGTSAHEAVAYAHKLGMDVIITDHHQVEESLPLALAVINPQRGDCDYPFKGICGAGVAFKLIMALRQRLREDGFFENKEEPNLKQFLDLLCVATVCDVVPLKDENRYFVKEGLRQIPHSNKPGLKALIKACEIKKEKLTTVDVGFKLGPRINACGRLKDAKAGVILLTTSDPVEATKQATLLDYLNRERQNVELKIVEDVYERIENEVDLDRTLGLVLYEPDWHVGVVGIVASRVVEKYGRPTIILCNGEDGKIKGSGRSIPVVNLIECLSECSDHLIKFGGHKAAAGVTLSADQIEGFIEAFDHAIKNKMNFEDTEASVLVDDDLTEQKVGWELMKELSLLEPHGMGNAKPLFMSSELGIRSKRIVGRGHLKLGVSTGGQNYDAIAFNKGEVIEELGDKAGVVFGLEVNRFRDVDSIQFVVKEFVK